MKKSKQLKTNIIYNSVGNFIFLAAQWLMTILVVSLSGYKDAGILSLSMAFANSIYALASFGMRGYQSSDNKYKYSNSTYIKSRLITCGISSLIFIIFICLNNYSIYTKLCVIFYLLYKVLEAFSDIYYGSIQREWSMKEIGISYGVHGIISLISFIVGLKVFNSLLVSIILMFITSLLVVLIYDRSAYKKRCTNNSGSSDVKSLLMICVPLVIYAFLFNNIQVYPKYLLERIEGETILGIYSSIAVPVLLIQVVAGYLFNPLLNVFSDYVSADEKDKYVKLINRVYWLIALLGIAGCIYIFFLGDISLKILFNEEILKYSGLLYSTLVVALLLSVAAFNNMLFTVTRKFGVLLRQNFVSLIMSIILSNCFIPKYGINGVNIALIISLALGILVSIVDVYNYRSKESDMMKKIKKMIVNFGVKHSKTIIKIFPKSLISKVESFANKTSPFERTEKINSDLKNGINIVGHIKGQYGLGQGGRSLVSAIQTTDIDYNVIAVENGTNASHGDTEFDDILTTNFDYNINLFHVQPYTSFEVGLSQIGNTNNLEGRYNIGYWVYETEDIPKKWAETFKYVNEVWTPSDFATKAFAKLSPVPVYTVPYGLRIEKDDTLTRKDFGIPEDKFIYLIMYDPSSLAERKNPKATIDAYLKAFKNNNDVGLVVVLNKATDEQIAKLKEDLDGVSNLTLINKTLPRKELYALISLCDVYVSLHRSEGFGLIMAESMFLGTVCVATAYSGNLQFMNEDNSCLVKYKMIDVDTSTQIVYEKGNRWADADVDDAAKYMKKLYTDKKFYKKLQKNAMEYVSKYLTPEHCGELIKKRYTNILKKVGKDTNE